MLFGDDISGKFIAKWPTFCKPRIITDGEILQPGAHVDDLLSALEESDYGKYKSFLFCFFKNGLRFNCIVYSARMGQ